MPEQLSVAATRPEQIGALEDAFELVEEDIQEGRIEVREWGGEVTDGEKIRVLAEAYTGRLEVNGNGGDSGK